MGRMGCIGRIQVRITEYVIDESLIGDYFHNKQFKRRFQQRLNRRWAEKDEIRARWQADEAQAPPRHAVNRG
jgi:hypothetical protein